MGSPERYTAIKAAVIQAIGTVIGFKSVLEYEPQSPQNSPFVYVLLDSYTRPQAAAHVTTTTYRFLARAANPIQNSKEAEEQLIKLAMGIADAVDINARLWDVIERGQAWSPEGLTGWHPIGGTPCRVVDCYINVLDKTDYLWAGGT